MPTSSTIVDNGPAANRVDIVFLGDGYTAAEIDTVYPVHIASAFEHMFNDGEDPFPRYRNFFNTHRVDVISQESGIDDPSEGIYKTTELDGTYDLAGIARLIGINNAKANTYLAQAPAPADIRMVTVNSTQYGGSGGYYAVYAGGDPASAEIALHELGHSFDALADEYWYYDGSTYTGSEPSAVNLTKSPTGAKWTEWLGYNQPGIGIIGAYEGGGYNDFGIYRPSDNSKMRSLDRPFDAISREKIIQDIYALVDPLDAWRGNGATLGNGASLWVQVLDPTVIQTEWRVDGELVPGTLGSGFRPSDFGFASGTHTVTARSYDPTDWVRRGKAALEQTRSWTINPVVTPVGVGLLESGGLTEVFEGAAADTYTLVLDSAPSADVTITLTPDDQLDVMPRTATFTSTNWNVPQTFQVTANRDGPSEGLHLGRVSHAVASADSAYNLLPMPSLVAVIHDVAPSVGIVVTPTSGLTTAESGGQATFTVALSSAPTAAVAINLLSTNTALGTVSPATLTFTPFNAFTPQVVTITGHDDGVADGDHQYSIITEPATSTDPNYNGLNPANVSVTSDGPLPPTGVTVTPTTGLVTAENGHQATFTLVLISVPTADVTISLSSSNPALGIVSPAAVTFTPANALNPQSVTVTGQDDGLPGGSAFYTIETAPASSADPAYDGEDPSDVVITSIDFLPRKGTFIDEDGDVFTVSLAGPGRMLMISDDPENDGAGPIDLLAVQNTDPVKSKLSVKVKRGPVGDGRVSIGSIEGSGLRSVTAASSNLSGTGIDLNGRLGSLKIRDVLAGATIRAAGTPAQKTTIEAHAVEDNVTFNLGTTISAFKAAAIGAGSIQAPSIGNLVVKGDAKNKVGTVLTPLVGHMKADLDITGTGDPKKRIALGTVRIAGDVLVGDWTVDGAIRSIKAKNWLGGSITADSLGTLSIKENFTGELNLSGSGIATGKAVLNSATVGRKIEGSTFIVGGTVNKFTAGEFDNSFLLVGYTPTSSGDPFAGGTFAAGTNLKNFRVAGIKNVADASFANSVVAAEAYGNVFLKSIDGTVTGTKFGLLAKTGIDNLAITTPSLKLKKIVSAPSLDASFGEFEIRVGLS